LPEFSLKVAALVIKQFDDGYRLLVHSFEHDPSLPLRFPGGGVDHDESIEEALHRELQEEAGLTGLAILRKLGVVRFFKRYSEKFIERHDYLMLADSGVADVWRSEVKGVGEDAGEVFRFQWIKPDELYLIDIELQKFLDQKHIPELYEQKVERKTQ
jgi:8-oxo-dGTP pyrophosphatase MutT (NUDIX family)